MSDPTSASTARLGQPKTAPHPLVLRLRGGETVTGNAFIPTIQSLAPFLASRKGGLLTLTALGGVDGASTGTHVMLRLASVLYGWSPDRTLAVENRAPGPTRRRVRVTFDDQSDVEGVVTCPSGQRVSDYLARAEDFVVVRQVRLPDAPGGIVDVAVHMNTVNTVRDLGAAEERTAAPSAAVSPSRPAGRPAATPPARETVVRRRDSSFTLVSFDDL